jgi:hypothetical protein
LINGLGFAMVATKVNAFIASLDAGGPNRDVGAFLEEAVSALGFASDADLARAMSVSPVTLASWKRRGKLPSEPAKWFQTIFPTMVFNRWRNALPSVANTAVAAALAATQRYYGEKLSDGNHLREASSAFGGLLALVPLIASTGFDVDADEAIEMPHDQLTQALAEALAWRAKHAA